MIQLLQRMDLKCTEPVQTDDLPCVLLIEDSKDLQIVIQLGLELISDVQVITSQTTDDWMLLVKHHNPDVIVLDLLPNGNDVLTALNHHLQTCDIPVVGLVVRDRPQDVHNSKAQGVSAIVSKPFDLDTLRDTIFDVLP